MRHILAVLTVALVCTTGVLVRSADTDVTQLQRRASPEVSAQAGRVDRLEALIERVEALSAMKRLQHAYGHYSELGLWHDFADLYADSGVVTNGEHLLARRLEGALVRRHLCGSGADFDNRHLDRACTWWVVGSGHDGPNCAHGRDGKDVSTGSAATRRDRAAVPDDPRRRVSLSQPRFGTHAYGAASVAGLR